MLFFYFVSIFGIFSCNSLLIFWVFLELNLIIFLVMINMDHRLLGCVFDKFSLMMYYFVVQSLGSLCLLMSLSLKEGVLVYSFLAVASTLKGGFWPLHTWFFRFSNLLSPFMCFLMLTFQKLPIIFLLFNLDFSLLFLVLISNMYFGSFSVYYFESPKMVLISSSLYSFAWFYMLFQNSMSQFFFFFFFYSLVIFVLIWEINSAMCSNSPFGLVTFLACFLFISGLPPINFFLYKYSVFSLLEGVSSYGIVISLWLCSFVALIGYTKVFYYEFMTRRFVFEKPSTDYICNAPLLMLLMLSFNFMF